METEGHPATSATSVRGHAHDRFKPLVGPFAVVAVIAATSSFAFTVGRAGTPSFWVWAVLPSVAIAVLALLRAYRDSELRDWTKFVWGDPTRGILSAAVLVALSLAFVHVMAPAGSARESWIARLYLQFGDPTALREHALEVAATIVVAATAEELVWRGLVTRQIAEVVGSRTAWVWAAVLYAVTYTPTLFTLSDPVAGKNPLLVLAALALGLFWGGMSRIFGRLVPAILSHAAFDWCVLMMFRLWGPGV